MRTPWKEVETPKQQKREKKHSAFITQSTEHHLVQTLSDKCVQAQILATF